MKFILTFARAYNFKDESTGRELRGVKINYLPIENMKPIADEDSKGVQVCSQSLPIEALGSITQVPAVYDCDTAIVIKNGVPTITVKSVKFVGLL